MADYAVVLALGLGLAIVSIVLALAGLTYVLHRAVTRSGLTGGAGAGAAPELGAELAPAEAPVRLTEQGNAMLDAYDLIRQAGDPLGGIEQDVTTRRLDARELADPVRAVPRRVCRPCEAVRRFLGVSTGHSRT